MLTGNKDLLNRLGALKKQIKEVENEIQLRIKHGLIDNSGYKIIHLKELDHYIIVDEDFAEKSEV